MRECIVFADLSTYWAQLRQTNLGWIHPDDEALLRHEDHTFNLDFPPPAFVGDIARAPVIILAANGGYDQVITTEEFQLDGAEKRYLDRLARPDRADWRDVAPYYRGVNYSALLFSGKAAIVNACAYRSRKISEEPHNRKLLKKLPSVGVNRAWLLESILPEAEAGRRLIVGKRHGLWDLPPEAKSSSGFIADPAPVSPHLSRAVWERVQQVLR